MKKDSDKILDSELVTETRDVFLGPIYQRHLRWIFIGFVLLCMGAWPVITFNNPWEFNKYMGLTLSSDVTGYIVFGFLFLGGIIFLFAMIRPLWIYFRRK